MVLQKIQKFHTNSQGLFHQKNPQEGFGNDDKRN